MVITDNVTKRIIELLAAEDYDGLVAYYKSRTAVLRHLIGLSYDKALDQSWRAIKGIGRIGAAMDNERVRTLVQRILWMMREESGNNIWTGAEILGEVVHNDPKRNEDIGPIIMQFHDEYILRTGVLRALYRVAQVRADLMMEFVEIPLEYLTHEDPAVRGYAVKALAALGVVKANRAAVEALVDDGGIFKWFDESSLVELRVGDVARQALKGA